MAAAIDDRTALVTVIHAQNEIGTVQPVREIARAAKAHGALIHTDAAQSVGKIPGQCAGAGRRSPDHRRPQAVRAQGHRRALRAQGREAAAAGRRCRSGARPSARDRECRLHRRPRCCVRARRAHAGGLARDRGEALRRAARAPRARRSGPHAGRRCRAAASQYAERPVPACLRTPGAGGLPTRAGLDRLGLSRRQRGALRPSSRPSAFHAMPPSRVVALSLGRTTTGADVESSPHPISRAHGDASADSDDVSGPTRGYRAAASSSRMRGRCSRPQ